MDVLHLHHLPLLLLEPGSGACHPAPTALHPPGTVWLSVWTGITRCLSSRRATEHGREYLLSPAYPRQSHKLQAGYTHRSIWSAWFAIIGLLWPLVSWPTAVRSENRLLWVGWTVSCLGTAVFPLLGVHQEENLIAMWVTTFMCRYVGTDGDLRTAGAVAMYALGILGLRRFEFSSSQDKSLFKTVTFILVGVKSTIATCE